MATPTSRVAAAPPPPAAAQPPRTTVVTPAPSVRKTATVEELHVGECVEIQQTAPDPNDPGAQQIKIFPVSCQARDGVFTVIRLTATNSACTDEYLTNQQRNLFEVHLQVRRRCLMRQAHETFPPPTVDASTAVFGAPVHAAPPTMSWAPGPAGRKPIAPQGYNNFAVLVPIFAFLRCRRPALCSVIWRCRRLGAPGEHGLWAAICGLVLGYALSLVLVVALVAWSTTDSRFRRAPAVGSETEAVSPPAPVVPLLVVMFVVPCRSHRESSWTCPRFPCPAVRISKSVTSATTRSNLFPRHSVRTR